MMMEKILMSPGNRTRLASCTTTVTMIWVRRTLSQAPAPQWCLIESSNPMTKLLLLSKSSTRDGMTSHPQPTSSLSRPGTPRPSAGSRDTDQSSSSSLTCSQASCWLVPCCSPTSYSWELPSGESPLVLTPCGSCWMSRSTGFWWWPSSIQGSTCLWLGISTMDRAISLRTPSKCSYGDKLLTSWSMVSWSGPSLSKQTHLRVPSLTPVPLLPMTTRATLRRRQRSTSTPPMSSCLSSWLSRRQSSSAPVFSEPSKSSGEREEIHSTSQEGEAKRSRMHRGQTMTSLDRFENESVFKLKSALIVFKTFDKS